MAPQSGRGSASGCRGRGRWAVSLRVSRTSEPELQGLGAGCAGSVGDWDRGRGRGRQVRREPWLLGPQLHRPCSLAAARDQAKDEYKATAEQAVSVRQQAAVRARPSAFPFEKREAPGHGRRACPALQIKYFRVCPVHLGLSISACLLSPQRSLYCNSS